MQKKVRLTTGHFQKHLDELFVICFCLLHVANEFLHIFLVNSQTSATWTSFRRLCFSYGKGLCRSISLTLFRILVAPWLWFRHISTTSTDKASSVWTWGRANGYLLPKDSWRCCHICVSLEMRTMYHCLHHTAVSNTHWGGPSALWVSMNYIHHIRLF